MSIPFANGTPPAGPPAMSAGPIFAGMLASTQLMTASFADVIASGAISVGAGGRVLIMVFASVENGSPTGHGADFQILDGASVILPQNSSGGQPTTGVHSYNSVLVGFPLMVYQTGLTPGSSHNYHFQAKEFDATVVNIVDACMAIWTW